MDDLSLKLKSLRENNHFTQKDFATILGISQQTYCNYENNKHDIPLHHLRKLAELYQVTSDYLLGLTNHKVPLPQMNAKFYKNLSYGEFLELLMSLKTDVRKSLIDYANFLWSRQK